MATTVDTTPDSHLAQTLAALRGLEFAGQAGDQQHLVPGVFFSLDPQAKNTVDVVSRPGELLDIRLTVERPGRWLSLNLGVGPADLTGCKIVGFACKCDAKVATTFRICLRSGHAGGHHDAFFPKIISADPQTALHLDILDISTQTGIPETAPWRELVIFFQCESHEISLRDFRFLAI